MPLERASGFSILMQRRHGGRKDLRSSAFRNAERRARVAELGTGEVGDADNGNLSN